MTRGSSPEIMPLAERDIAACAQIMARSMPWPRYGLTEDAAHALWSQALAQGAAVAVARVGGRTVGFAWYIQGGAFGLSGYLKLLGVAADARGQGVGRALLDHTELMARSHGERELFLLVSDFNLDAQQFYQAHGYRQVGALTDYVQAGIAELIFRKSL